MKQKLDTETHDRKDLDRLTAFSDGVFAIAITLLVLNFKIPDPVSAGYMPSEFYSDLRSQIPALAGYILSFLVVGAYWISHHRMIRYAVRLDAALLWQNILLLLFIGLMPTTTLLLSRYGYASIGTVPYAANIAIVGLVQIFIWRHASKNHRLIHANLSSDIVAVLQVRSFFTPTIFALSIPLALSNPDLAELSWLLSPLVWSVFRRAWPRYKRAAIAPGFVKCLVLKKVDAFRRKES